MTFSSDGLIDGSGSYTRSILSISTGMNKNMDKNIITIEEEPGIKTLTSETYIYYEFYYDYKDEEVIDFQGHFYALDRNIEYDMRHRVWYQVSPLKFYEILNSTRGVDDTLPLPRSAEQVSNDLVKMFDMVWQHRLPERYEKMFTKERGACQWMYMNKTGTHITVQHST